MANKVSHQLAVDYPRHLMQQSEYYNARVANSDRNIPEPHSRSTYNKTTTIGICAMLVIAQIYCDYYLYQESEFEPIKQPKEKKDPPSLKCEFHRGNSTAETKEKFISSAASSNTHPGMLIAPSSGYHVSYFDRHEGMESNCSPYQLSRAKDQFQKCLVFLNDSLSSLKLKSKQVVAEHFLDLVYNCYSVMQTWNCATEPLATSVEIKKGRSICSQIPVVNRERSLNLAITSEVEEYFKEKGALATYQKLVKRAHELCISRLPFYNPSSASDEERCAQPFRYFKEAAIREIKGTEIADNSTVFLRNNFALYDNIPSLDYIGSRLADAWSLVEQNPIRAAAIAHQTIAESMPFCSGNGRIARVFMNAILLQGGYLPIATLSEHEYRSAVDHSLQDGNTHIFEEYIAEKICAKGTTRKL